MMELKILLFEKLIQQDEMQIPLSDFTANFVPIIESKRIAEISNDILFEYQPEGTEARFIRDCDWEVAVFFRF